MAIARIAAAARCEFSWARILARKSIAKGIRTRAIAVKRASWNSPLKAFSNRSIKVREGALPILGLGQGNGGGLGDVGVVAGQVAGHEIERSLRGQMQKAREAIAQHLG